MDYQYTIELAGRKVKVESNTWRQISNYIHSGQWFYIVYMGKLYKYSLTHPYFDRPSVYIFDVVKENANDTIKYVYLNSENSSI